MKIIELIKKYRKEKGYTQTDLANLLNIAQTTYSDIESEKIQLKAEDFIKICVFLELDIANFNTEENEINIKLTSEEIKILKNISKKINSGLYLKEAQNNTINLGHINKINNVNNVNTNNGTINFNNNEKEK